MIFIDIFTAFIYEIVNLSIFGYFSAFLVFSFCVGVAVKMMRGKRG